MNKWMKLIASHKKETLKTVLFVALEVSMDIVIPLLMAYIIDYGISDGNKNTLLFIGLFLFLACLFSLVTGILSGKYSALASSNLATTLRKTMFYRVQDFSFANIDYFSTSSLVTRLTTDVTNVQNAFQMIIRTCVKAPLLIIFSIVMAFWINRDLAWIFVGVVPLIGLGLGIIMIKALPIFRRVFRLYDKLNGVVQENLRGIRVVKSFVREDYEISKFKNSSGEIYNDFVKAERILAFNSPLMQFCMYATTLLICWLGAKLIVTENLLTGQLMMLLTYSTQILMSMMMLSMVFVMVTMSRASMERIKEILDTESDIQEIDNPVTEVSNGDISFRNVNFGYKGAERKLSLANINLDIKSGQTVGIIGGTGSGKTTLISLIPRLYDVTDGSVSVAGVDVKKYGLKTLRDNVAVVLQKNLLFSGTIKDNLRWGNENATDEEIIHAAKLAQADEFIRAFSDGYDTWIEQGGSNVSGGQRQRLCIARALLKNPKILILDDSTSAVDTKTDALIREALRNKIPDTTKLIIAQRISSVQDADQIIIMHEGTIQDKGTHPELLERNTIYRELYESQQKGESKDVK